MLSLKSAKVPSVKARPTPAAATAAALIRRAAASVGAAVLALSLAAAAPASEDIGQKVFNSRCLSCHIGGLNTTPNPTNWNKTLKRDALEKYDVFSAEEIAEQVRKGKGGMPAYRKFLTEEEVQAVAQYVMDKATADSW